MLGIGLKQVWAYKRRLTGTLVAVALGVAFLAGTLLLGDTLRANFDRLFHQANSSSEVLLRSATKVGTSGGQDLRAGISASVLSRVAHVPGVAQAEPYVEGPNPSAVPKVTRPTMTTRTGRGVSSVVISPRRRWPVLAAPRLITTSFPARGARPATSR